MYTFLNGPSLSSVTFEALSEMDENGEVDE